MDAQRRATSGRPSMASATKKRGLGSDAPGSSARGSEDRSSVAPPPPPRGTKRAREIEGIDKVCCFRRHFFGLLRFPHLCCFRGSCVRGVIWHSQLPAHFHGVRTYAIRDLPALLQTKFLQGGKFAFVKCRQITLQRDFLT
jgi:hypothetical protein